MKQRTIQQGIAYAVSAVSATAAQLSNQACAAYRKRTVFFVMLSNPLFRPIRGHALIAQKLACATHVALQNRKQRTQPVIESMLRSHIVNKEYVGIATGGSKCKGCDQQNPKPDFTSNEWTHTM